MCAVRMSHETLGRCHVKQMPSFFFGSLGSGVFVEVWMLNSTISNLLLGFRVYGLQNGERLKPPLT